MLWNRLLSITLDNLKTNDINYSLLDWSDTNETIVFIEKNNSIYRSFYDNNNETFSTPLFFINGYSSNPARNGDYISLSFIYNEKVQNIDVTYTDLVAGLTYSPLNLWDGMFTTTSSFSNSDIYKYDPWIRPLDLLPDVTTVNAFLDTITWGAVSSPPTRYDLNTFYRLYEGDEMTLIADNLTDTAYVYADIKPVTKYTVTRVYYDRWFPNPEYETDGAFVITNNELFKSEYAVFEFGNSQSTKSELIFNNITPITPPANSESTSTFTSSFSVTDKMSNSGFYGYGLQAVSQTPKYIDDVPPTSMSTSMSSMSYRDLTFTNYYGSFIE